jgi:hypothetical protein
MTNEHYLQLQITLQRIMSSMSEMGGGGKFLKCNPRKRTYKQKINFFDTNGNFKI